MTSPPEPALAEFLLVAGIGALAGASELVARYRDAPVKSLRSWSAVVYLLINASAAISALLLVDTFGWTFGFETDTDGLRAVRILVAGLGAMALFRSSLFVIRLGEQEVGVGPSALLQSFLDAAERGVDRKRARQRAKVVRKALSQADISYDVAEAQLPALCLGLVQNPTADDELKLVSAVTSIRSTNFNDDVKLKLLALALLTFGGEGVLRDGVELLRQRAPESSPEKRKISRRCQRSVRRASG